MSVNRIVLSGRLTADPQLRVAGENQAVICTMRLAIQRRRTGNADRGAVFIDVTTFDRQAQNCAKFLRKGARVLIDGRLELSQWKTPEGQIRSKHEVIAQEVEFLDPAKAPAPQPQPTPENQPADSPDAASPDDTSKDLDTCVGQIAHEDENPAYVVAS